MTCKIASAPASGRTPRNDILNQELRKFGFNLGLGLNILGCIMFYRHKGHFIWFSGIGSIAIILAILSPALLKPIKKFLDAVIFSFGQSVGFISLLIVFYLIVAPMGILLRLIGKDLLHQKIDKKSASYWLSREAKSRPRESYEQMG